MILQDFLFIHDGSIFFSMNKKHPFRDILEGISVVVPASGHMLNGMPCSLKYAYVLFPRDLFLYILRIIKE